MGSGIPQRYLATSADPYAVLRVPVRHGTGY